MAQQYRNLVPQPVFAAQPIPLNQDDQMVGIDISPQDYNNAKMQGLLPEQLMVGNNQQQVVNTQPQQVVADVSPQTMAVAGAQSKGIDWRGALQTLGSYLDAAGQGINPSATTMGAGLSGAGDAVLKHQQAIRNFDTMTPQYQTMGIDTSRLDPRRGGAGISTTPEKLIDLQSQIDQRNMNNLYRQQMIQSLQQKQQGTQGGKVLTVGQLMMLSPEFKARMQGQYDFSGGQNADLLNQQIPASLLQGFMPAKKTNMIYSGGLKSSKTSNATIRHTGGTSGGSGSKTGGKSGGIKKLIF